MKGTVQTEPRRTTDGRAEQEYASPDVNIVENKDGYVLEAEMPGVSKDGWRSLSKGMR